MAEAGIPAEAAAGDVALVADKAAWQRVTPGLAEARIGPLHHPGAGAQVGHFGAIGARADHHALARCGRPGRFRERPEVAQARVLRPRLCRIRAAAHRAALPVRAALRVEARAQREAAPFPVGGDAAAAGGARHVRGHRHRHRAQRIGVTQAVVVHHVVRLVAPGAGLQLAQRAVEGLFETQTKAVAAELRAVHAAPGIAGAAVAGTGGDFQQGVGSRRPTQRHIGIPLRPCGGHARAVAVGVIVRLRTVGAHPRIARRRAGAEVQHLVIAAEAADQQAGLRAQIRRIEARRLPLEAHRAGRCARPPQHGLRAFHHDQAVIGFRRHIGQRVVHPRRAGTGHAAVVG